MKKIFSLVSLLFVGLLLVSCNKDEGTGGTACIEGTVYKILHDDDNYDMSADTIKAAKQDVFIVYGDDTYIGDDVETDQNGTYRFKYLTPGTYTVYAYSLLATGERVAESTTVTVGRGETATAADIYINEGKAYGTSMIKGWVWCTYFDKNGDDVRSTWAYDQRVYIQRIEEDYHFDDTRVGLDGVYYFQKLQPGEYIIFTFAQNDDETPYVVSDTVTVEETGKIYQADTLSIRLKA